MYRKFNGGQAGQRQRRRGGRGSAAPVQHRPRLERRAVLKRATRYGYVAGKLVFELAGDIVSMLTDSVPVLDQVLSFAELGANLGENFADLFIDENSTERVTASYDWFIAETVSLVFSKAGTNTKRTIGFFNSISGEVSGYVNILDYSGHWTEAHRERFAERVDWRAPNFGNGANALKYYIDTGTRYEVKVDSIDIKSLTNEGTILHTIELQNPLSLNEIY